MGQAKKRGSFEKRKELAIILQKQKDIENKELKWLEHLEELEKFNSLSDEEKIEYTNRKKSAQEFLNLTMNGFGGAFNF